MAQMKQEAQREYREARAADRKARKAKPHHGQRWVENYPLSIVRYVEHDRENADVMVEGAPVRYEIKERTRWSSTTPRTWTLYTVFPHDDTPTDVVTDGNDFESLIQRAVVMAVGAAYYGGHIEQQPPAKPGRKGK
jgi:hypothetical protein